MSINVTVTGNPVSIKRGKMVTGNPYDEKQEYEKRRLMRLEQVRQQSKEFAQDVRNKVRREKKKQLGEVEKQGEEKLKSWQNRRLLDLQSQYRDALDEIGMGHKAAEEFENEEEFIEQKKQQNNFNAQARGKVAAVRSQIEKNETNYKKALPIQHKKIVRDIENNRAAMVSNLTKHKKVKNCCKKRKKLKSTDINITLPNRNSSESTEEASESAKSSSMKEESDSECWEDCSCSDESSGEGSSNGHSELGSAVSKGQEFSKPHERSQDPSFPRRPLADQTSYRQSIENRKKLIDNFQIRNVEYPQETRISDRIRQRELQASEPDFCDFVKASKVETVGTVPYKLKSPKKKSACNYIDPLKSKENLDPTLENVCECIHYHATCPCKRKSANEPFRNISVQTDQYPSRDKCTCNHHQPHCPKASKSARNQYVPEESGRQAIGEDFSSNTSVGTTAVRPRSLSATKPSQKYIEVPSKPPIILKGVERGVQSTKSVKTTTTSLPESQRVNYYDHPNRYQGTLPSSTTVERIGSESLEAMPNVVSEAEWHEKIRQRDRDAEIRGRKAMEKELIRRDYEDMMKKLPLLQKKEHIAEIGKDKPEYHMSEERLKELEKKKQLRLENVYTKAFPDLKPAVVTLPGRKYAVPTNSNEPFTILEPSDPRIKHTGKWDTDFDSPKMFTAQEVQEIIRSFTGQKQEDRYSKLKQLLKSLKVQKEQLINELKALPRDDSVNALLEDLNSVSDSDERQKSRRRKRDKDDEDKKKRHYYEKDRKRRHTSSDDPSSFSDSGTKDMGEYKHNKDKKKSKKRQRVLVLQNMSTQTTPKVPRNKPTSSSEGSKENLGAPPVNICKKIHTPCDCKTVKGYGSSEELCQILIKLQDNEDPTIEVVSKGDATEERKEKIPDIKSPKKKLERKSRKTDKEQVAESSREARKGESPSKTREKSRRSSPRKLESKVLGQDTEVFKKPLPREPRNVKLTTSNSTSDRNKSDSIRSKRDTSRQESWKEQLSKNSISTSSTSYFSPPDFSKMQNNTDGKGSLYNLRQKPKQQNISTASFNGVLMDPKVLKYVEKLLSMSKASVDDLQVSSSDVQTPSQSVIEMESNNPLAELHNIVKFMNIKANEVAKELSYSTDGDASAVPPNSTINVSDDLRSRSHQTLERSDKSLEQTQISKNCSRDSLLHQYTDVTDSCSKRIANLAAMIERLREEKMRMLKDPSVREESPKSAKDYSTTAYLDLPNSEKSVESSKNSTATSLDEEELNRRLLEIDMSLAEKLKRFSQAKQMNAQGEREMSEQENYAGPSKMARSLQPQVCDPDICSDDDNRQFLERLKKLMEKSDEYPARSRSPNLSKPLELSQPQELTRKSPDLPISESKTSFVPLLLNIPQLPVLEAVPDDYVLEGGRKHPPPSKGLAAIKRLNGNVSVVPHELSTIVEADSQLSTKISPNTSKLSISPSKDLTPQQVRTTPREKVSESIIDGVPPLIPPEKTLQSHYESKDSDESPRQAQKVSRSFPVEKSVDFASKTDQEKHTKLKSRTLDDEVSKDPSSSASSKYDKSSKSNLSTQTSKSTESSSVSIVCTDATCNSLSRSSASKTSLGNSSSSDDLKSLEAMLKSIGMEWAIPTLHKTQEALALASSSSSPEVSSSRKNKTNRSQNSPCCSEISLKDFLTKQMISKISSSSMKSEASPASFLHELSDISAIQASSGSEKNKQRTSTPLGSKAASKSRDSQMQFFTGASDISSVKDSPKKSCWPQKKQKHKTEEEVFKSLSDSARSTSNS